MYFLRFCDLRALKASCKTLVKSSLIRDLIIFQLRVLPEFRSLQYRVVIEIEVI